MTDKMRSIALGQGQGSIAAAMIEKVCISKPWLLFSYNLRHDSAARDRAFRRKLTSAKAAHGLGGISWEI